MCEEEKVPCLVANEVDVLSKYTDTVVYKDCVEEISSNASEQSDEAKEENCEKCGEKCDDTSALKTNASEKIQSENDTVGATCSMDSKNLNSPHFNKDSQIKDVKDYTESLDEVSEKCSEVESENRDNIEIKSEQIPESNDSNPDLCENPSQLEIENDDCSEKVYDSNIEAKNTSITEYSVENTKEFETAEDTESSETKYENRDEKKVGKKCKYPEN